MDVSKGRTSVYRGAAAILVFALFLSLAALPCLADSRPSPSYYGYWGRYWLTWQLEQLEEALDDLDAPVYLLQQKVYSATGTTYQIVQGFRRGLTKESGRIRNDTDRLKEIVRGAEQAINDVKGKLDELLELVEDLKFEVRGLWGAWTAIGILIDIEVKLEDLCDEMDRIDNLIPQPEAVDDALDAPDPGAAFRALQGDLLAASRRLRYSNYKLREIDHDLRRLFGTLGYNSDAPLAAETRMDRVLFQAGGAAPAPASWQIRIFDLQGRAVYTGGFTEGRELVWELIDSAGAPVANGVYLYVVIARGHDGQVVRGEVGRLMVLR